MIRGVAYSRRLFAVSLGAVVAACAMALLHQLLTSGRIERRRRTMDIEGRLSGQILAMADCEDSRVEALRARVGRFQVQLRPEDTWERLMHLFGSRWKAEAGTQDNKEDFSYLVGTFTLLSPTVSDWPKILETIKASELLAGVGISRFEMKTSGTRKHRSVDLVTIAVAIHGRPSVSNP